jgi:lipid-binding SYLF domain-containing protein
MKRTLFSAVPLVLAGLAMVGGPVWADGEHASAGEHTGNMHQAEQRVRAARNVVERMHRDPDLRLAMERAHGLFIVPSYGRGAFIVGGQGGGGVVLVKHAGAWSDPAFFDIGGGSIGAQIGGEGGSVVMLLMTPRAVHRFEDSNGGKWSLNGNAGATIAKWSGKSTLRSGADIVVWSDVSGLYGGLTASVTDISPDRQLDRAYYGHRADSHEILTGTVTNVAANSLRDALAMRVATR